VRHRLSGACSVPSPGFQPRYATPWHRREWLDQRFSTRQDRNNFAKSSQTLMSRPIDAGNSGVTTGGHLSSAPGNRLHCSIGVHPVSGPDTAVAPVPNGTALEREAVGTVLPG
jgi:hypothetical protein